MKKQSESPGSAKFSPGALLHAWVTEIDASIIVTDKDGIIIEMNDAAIRSYEKDGGADLIGQNVLDCHPEDARQKLEDLMQAKISNSYSIEKNGVKKIVQQMPWFVGGEFQGMVEIVFQIPFDLPHFIRENDPE
ncbi:MAG TPA: PAS domain-containing protein [Candidatus Lokiarchaeia archaeon]|nr:PAS domain-containing protein [Candidatus Lokiarchaeia archaeon]